MPAGRTFYNVWKARCRAARSRSGTVNSLCEKGLPLPNAISSGGRPLSRSATCFCHRFRPDRTTQATPDRATRTIRQSAGPFSVPRRSISVYPYRNTNVTVAYANTYSDSNPRRNTYTYWDSNAHLGIRLGKASAATLDYHLSTLNFRSKLSNTLFSAASLRQECYAVHQTMKDK